MAVSPLTKFYVLPSPTVPLSSIDITTAVPVERELHVVRFAPKVNHVSMAGVNSRASASTSSL
jgi:hypothetical protein